MAIDINKAKQRLEQLQSKGKDKPKFEKKDYSKIYWKPKVGKQIIRIVPSKFNKDYPLTTIESHKNIVKPTMYALTNWGEKDPIIEFARKLYNSGDAEQKELAKKLFPKKRTVAQVVVRGEEVLGTRLWDFGVEVEEQLLNLISDEQYGDISDITDGVDLTVTGVNASFSRGDGSSAIQYVKPTIVPARKSSPLTTDPDLLKKLLDEQQDPLDLGKKYTFDEIKEFLRQWLNPDADEAQEATSDETSEESNDTEAEEGTSVVDGPPSDIVDDLPFENVPEVTVAPPPPKKLTTKKTTQAAPANSKKEEFERLFPKK